MQLQRSGSVWRGFGSVGPAGFFALGETGLFFDFSDPRTLTTDAAGATPLTAPGQTIGLVADKSRIRAPITSYAGVQASAGLRPAWGRAPNTRRNLLLGTAALATQSRAVIAAAHTLSFKGTGTITLTGASTAGPLLGTGADNRVALTFTPTAGGLTLTVAGSVTEAQLETAGAATPYQFVNSAFDMTEAGAPAFGYTRLDGADDKLTVTLPGAITGDLMIFGRNGSWIETGVTLPSGAFDLGPTGTVLTPGVLRALGDLVGIVIIARTTTAAERALALRYFAARGAAGWLLAGAELITNGTFAVDASGWVSNNATLAVVGGELEFTATVSVHNVQRGVTVVPGTPYLFTFLARRGTIAALKYSVYNATGLADIVPSTAYAADATMRPWQFVFIAPAGCVTANVYMARDSGSTGTAYFDNVSVKPLTVGA